MPFRRCARELRSKTGMFAFLDIRSRVLPDFFDIISRVFVDLFSQHIRAILRPKSRWSVTTAKPCEYWDKPGF